MGPEIVKLLAEALEMSSELFRIVGAEIEFAALVLI